MSQAQTFQQLPWLNSLSSDGQSVSLPGLPETPLRGSQSRFFQLAFGEVSFILIYNIQNQRMNIFLIISTILVIIRKSNGFTNFFLN